MAHLITGDLALETSTSTGTGAMTLAGAVTGHQTFAQSGAADTNTIEIMIRAVDANGIPTGDWERSIATYSTTGPTLTRTTILQSSNSDAAVSFAAGTKRIYRVATREHEQLYAAAIVQNPSVVTGGTVVFGDMLASNNLSDVANAATARNNILPSKTGNALKALRVNAGETDYELVTLSGGGSPAGSTTQIQFNNAGAFGASADLTFDDSTNTLTLGGTDTKIVTQGITNEPSAPSSGMLTQYVKAISGRMMPKIKGPSGLDTAMQTALFQNRVLMYIPSTGTTGTGSGTSFGPVWTSGGTVTHPTPSSTSPAISNQMRRTRYANVVTTTNQTLGIKAAAADTLNFWRGNAAGLGGFFYCARFIVELWAASTCRIFAGLTASSATYVVASDTVLNNTCGLWHDTTDPNSGANSFNFVTRDTTTTTKQSIALSNAIAAGNSYDFYMFCQPNGSTIYWRLDDIVNGVTYEGNTSTTLPANTAFMGPQCAMSNGTANITVTTVAIGIAGVYTEADR